MSLRIGAQMPELSGATEWLNDAAAPQSGAPTLVHFWSTSCPVCEKNLPKIQAWTRRFGEKGLRVVAVYVPDGEGEADIAKVRRAAERFGITGSCMVDGKGAVRDAFLNTHGCSPACYLFDAEGKLRSRTAGDAGLRMLEGALKRLMEPKDAAEAISA